MAGSLFIIHYLFKQNNSSVGYNKNLLSFPKHDSLKYWRLKSNVNSHMSIQFVNQSESLSLSFSDLLGDKCCLQRKYMCRQRETLGCRQFPQSDFLMVG